MADPAQKLDKAKMLEKLHQADGGVIQNTAEKVTQSVVKSVKEVIRNAAKDQKAAALPQVGDAVKNNMPQVGDAVKNNIPAAAKNLTAGAGELLKQTVKPVANLVQNVAQNLTKIAVDGSKVKV